MTAATAITAPKNARTRSATKRIATSPADSDRQIKKAKVVTDENTFKKPLFEDISSSDEGSSGLSSVGPTRVATPMPSPLRARSTNLKALVRQPSMRMLGTTETALSTFKFDLSPIKEETGDTDVSGTKPMTPIRFGTDSDVPPLELAYPPSSDTASSGSSVSTKQDGSSPTKASNGAISGATVLESHGPNAYARFPRDMPQDDEKGKQVVGKIHAAWSLATRENTGPVQYVPLNGDETVKEAPEDWKADLENSDNTLVHAGVKSELEIRDFLPSLEGYINPGYITSNAMRRIVAIAQRDNPYADRYRIANLPLSAGWGRLTVDEDNSRYLCANNHVIRATVVGRVVKAFFFTLDGEPQPRVNIGIVPLRKQDLVAYNALMNNHSSPKLIEDRDIIYAGRFQTERVRGASAQKCLPYNRVFDMQEGPTIKKKPQSAAMIAEGDIVMLECNIYRFKPLGPNGQRRPSKAWESWVVSLELQDIIYLFQRPDGGDEYDNEVTVVSDGEEY